MNQAAMDDSLHDSEHCGVAVAEADCSELVDRLSELPDCLILHILSLMPMEDVVITTILSKRWKDLWTTVPGLDFRIHSDYKDLLDLDEFQNFVREALAVYRGAKIQKFSLSFMIDQSKSFLDLLLQFAIEKQVEELCIELILQHARYMLYHESSSYAPQCLYSCSSLTTLTIVSFTLNNITERVQWNHLKSLTIQGENLIQRAMNHILSGSPRLEVLNLSLTENGEDFNIESSSLNMLKIDMYLACPGRRENLPKSTVLRILAPNLESLEISGVRYGRCLLNVPSLTSATLGFDERDWYMLLEEMLWQLFLTISHVQKVTLTDWCIKFLLEMKKKDMHVLFSNPKILKLYPGEADGMLDVLEIFPELRMLVVEHNEVFSLFMDEEEAYINKVDACNTLAPKAILPNPSILQLKTVEITWQLRDAASIIPIIEILLENAHMLEKMVIRLRTNGADPETFVLVEEKVLSEILP